MSRRPPIVLARLVRERTGRRDPPGSPIDLVWAQHWQRASGRGIRIGLVDVGIDPHAADLRDADTRRRPFGPVSDALAAGSDHGTRSAAILGAQGRRGLCGVAPRATLLTADVADPAGVSSSDSVCAAIDWLLGEQVDLLVIPMGGDADDAAIGMSVETAHQRGVLVFCAAGNGHPDPVMFPARHRSAIAVGACGLDRALVPECARTPRLDLIAPGARIPALAGDGRLAWCRGTSIACVLAAGIAALHLSTHGPRGCAGRSRSQVLRALTAANADADANAFA